MVSALNLQLQNEKSQRAVTEREAHGVAGALNQVQAQAQAEVSRLKGELARAQSQAGSDRAYAEALNGELQRELSQLRDSSHSPEWRPSACPSPVLHAPSPQTVWSPSMASHFDQNGTDPNFKNSS